MIFIAIDEALSTAHSEQPMVEAMGDASCGICSAHPSSPQDDEDEVRLLLAYNQVERVDE